MAYQVKLKRITEKDILDRVVAEIVKSSGASSEKVAESLSSQAWTSIGRNFDRARAKELKVNYEALGAKIQAVDLDDLDDDDDDQEEGRVRTQEEFVKMLNERADIFEVEDDSKKTKLVFPILFVLGIFLSWYMAVVFEIEIVAVDFYERHIREHTVQMAEVSREPEAKPEPEPTPQPQQQQQREEQRPTERRGTAAPTGGGGDPRARIATQGVLGVLSGAVATNVAGGGGQGGFAAGIDAVISGAGGLQAGGGGGSGRAGAGGIGFGSGTGSGFGGGTGGVDALAGLMGGGGGNMQFERRAEVRVREPSAAQGAGISGGRTRASIMRVVNQNLASLRHAYNMRLRDVPGMQGRVTIKWAIDEFGNVIHAEIVSSTIGDATFEQTVLSRVRSWVFGRIESPGDVTETTFPFVFAPD